MHVSVLGAGSWGTTLAILLAEHHHDVTLWSFSPSQAEQMQSTRFNPEFLPDIEIPSRIEITADLHHAVRGCELIVAAVPSQYLRSVVEPLKDLDFSRTVFVNVAKGIENGTLMTMSEVLGQVVPRLPPDQIVTLSGPSHAEEVSKRVPTTVVAASTNLGTARL
ncbi:MAG TPA: 2-dehydropantoate 2-reductase N-terminal domain-containing protein, partial [Bacteroidota bacterium]|nr:2-dehydropantoate 2-reductase N-terminal domain-containing protein [Bacteroidota bacterium]